MTWYIFGSICVLLGMGCNFVALVALQNFKRETRWLGLPALFLTGLFGWGSGWAFEVKEAAEWIGIYASMVIAALGLCKFFDWKVPGTTGIFKDMKTAIILLSRSGGGKGTQAKFLQEHFGKEKTLYIYTGDGLRALINQHPDLLAATYMQKKVMDAGEKAPDFSAIWVWAGRMINEFTSEAEVVIFDGSPRTRLEAQALDEALEFFEIENVKPLLLEVEREEAIQRLLKRGRADDTRERIERRLAYYERTVMPAIDYYEHESKHKLIRIDGMPSPEEVFKQIKKVL